MLSSLSPFRWLVAGTVLLTGSLGWVDTQQPATIAPPSSATEEHLQFEPWWPTKSTPSLKAYAGSASCTTCHQDESVSQDTAMQRAARPVADASSHMQQPIPPRLLAPFTYSVTGASLEVKDGDRHAAHSLDWVLGAGDLGQTFLFQQDNHWFQSQVTYYTHPGKLDTTTGFHASSGDDLLSALGQKLSADEARRCFGCHTVHATTSSGFNPAKAEAGLGCEACHGPGRAHVEEMTANPTAKPSKQAIFNPAHLSPANAIDFCGACHRTSLDATLGATPATLGTAAVRFQPYRLQQSKCWRATASERLTCTGCHDPHQPLVRSITAYDKTCLGCHSAHPPAQAELASKPVLCPKATANCVSCHMPKVEVESMHGSFTDHRIRIAQAGESFSVE